MLRSRADDARPRATATTAAPAVATGDWLVRRAGCWLLVDLGRAHRALGWTIVGGGFARTRGVAWLGVRNADLSPDVDPVALVHEALRDEQLDAHQPVFVTSSSLDAYVDVSAAADDVTARCIATVGMSNAGRVGTSTSPTTRDPKPFGTINLLCAVSRPLTDLALIEALSIVAEARTTGVLDARIALAGREGQGLATGTGTDCCVVAAPADEAQTNALAYAGLHTAVGEALGRATLEAVSYGVQAWREAAGR